MQLFPRARLFPLKIADPREVQLSARFLAARREFAGNVGYSVGLFQFAAGGVPTQLRVEGHTFLVSKLESPDFPVQSTDFTIAFPLQFSVNRYAARLLWGHISSHLGDDFSRIDNVNDVLETVSQDGFTRPKKFSREFIEISGSYQAQPFRVYAGAVWTYHIAANPGEDEVSQTVTPQLGIEFIGKERGLLTPYLAADFKTHEEFQWSLDYNIQIGLMVGTQTLSRMRLALEFFDGHSTQGQFRTRKEQDVNLVVTFDF